MALNGGAPFAFVPLPLLPSAYCVVHSLQPHLPQRGNMPLQHHWVFDRLSLFVNLQRELRNLTARGVEVHNVAASPDLLEIERASTFGARIWVESA